MKKSHNYKRLYNRAKTLYHMLSIKAFRKKPYPFYVNLVINSQCNLRCAYCFGKYSYRSQSYWEFEDLKQLVDALYKKGTRYILVQGGGEPFASSTRRLVEWMDEEGMAEDWLKEVDWTIDYEATTLKQELAERVEAEVTKFIAFKTKRELMEEGGVVTVNADKLEPLSQANKAKSKEKESQTLSERLWEEFKEEFGDLDTIPFIEFEK